MVDKEEVGTALMIAGVFIAFVGFTFPQQVAGGLATVIVDTTPPSINAGNPSGPSSTPTHFDPDTTVTLQMSTANERVNNPRVNIDGTTHSLSFDHEESYAVTRYFYTTSWSTSGHSGNKLSFTFKGDDDAGNIGSDTAYAVIGSYADGYFTLNGQKMSKGGTITISTRSITLEFTTTTSTSPDKVWYFLEKSDGTNLKTETDTAKTSGSYTWSYTFPSDGTYKIEGYCKSYGNTVQVMSFMTGVNSPPSPGMPFPSETMVVIGVGFVMASVGAVVRFKPEAF